MFSSPYHRQNPAVVSTDAPAIVELAVADLPDNLQRRVGSGAVYVRHLAAWLKGRAQSAFAARGLSVAPPVAITGPGSEAFAEGTYDLMPAIARLSTVRAPAAQKPAADIVQPGDVRPGDLLILHGYDYPGVTLQVTEVLSQRGSDLYAAVKEIEEKGERAIPAKWYHEIYNEGNQVGYRVLKNRSRIPDMIQARRAQLSDERRKAERKAEEDRRASTGAPWLADLIQTVVGSKYGNSSDVAEARAIMRYLKSYGINASITVRRYSMASGMDFNPKKGVHWTQEDARIIGELLIGQVREGLNREGTQTVLYVDNDFNPRAREDRSDPMSDYHAPGGVRIPIQYAPQVTALLAEELKKAGKTISEAGEQAIRDYEAAQRAEEAARKRPRAPITTTVAGVYESPRRPEPEPAPFTSANRYSVRYVKEAGDWVNLGIVEIATGKPLRYGWNTTQQRWNYQGAPPAEVLSEAVAAGLPAEAAETAGPAPREERADRPADRPVAAPRSAYAAPAPAAPPSYGAKLRTLADAMQDTIDDKLRGGATSNQNWTPRRAGIMESMRSEGMRMLKVQTALRGIADLQDSGEAAAYDLDQIKTKADIERMITAIRQNEYREQYGDKPHPLDKAQRKVAEILSGVKPAAAAPDNSWRKHIGQIPGFVPTPPDLAARMAAIAYDMIDIHAPRILEPEAGNGHLVDAALLQWPNGIVTAIEVNHTLADTLRNKYAGNKRVTVQQGDIQNFDLADQYDIVLMNPPFENGADTDHVRHAFKALENGGVLVAIMSEGPFFRSDKKATAFRTWLANFGAYASSEKLPDAFKGYGVGVAARLVTIQREDDMMTEDDSDPDSDELGEQAYVRIANGKVTAAGRASDFAFVRAGQQAGDLFMVAMPSGVISGSVDASEYKIPTPGAKVVWSLPDVEGTAYWTERGRKFTAHIVEVE